MAEEKALAEYKAADGEEIAITQDFIKTYICNNQNLTTQEMAMYAHMCKAQEVNPLSREIYLIKYGDNPAQVVTGKDFWIRSAHEDPSFDGISAGVTVAYVDKWDANGKPIHSAVERREGSLVGRREKLVGGWCKVYTKNKKVPFYDEVNIEEYSTKRALWKTKPATMIRKVAICHAMREAFPRKFSGLYSEEELAQSQPLEVKQEPAAVEPAEVEVPSEDVPAEVIEQAFEGAVVEEF